MLAAHHGFTDEELDFIPSTKLRVGIPSVQLRADINRCKSTCHSVVVGVVSTYAKESNKDEAG